MITRLWQCRFELPSKHPQFIFEELGDPEKTKWRLLKYQDNPHAWIDYPSRASSDINQGKAISLTRERVKI